MELRDYLSLFKRWWWLFAVLGFIVAVVAFAVTPRVDDTYEATTTVLINQGNDQLPDVQTVITGQRLASTYAELMKARPVLEQVILNLGLSMDAEELGENINVITLSGTNLLELSVRDSDPNQAANIANEIVRVFILQNQEVQAGRYALSKETIQAEIDQLLIEIEASRTRVDLLQVEIDRIQSRIDALNNRELIPSSQGGGLTQAQQEERTQLESDVDQKITKRNQIQTELDQSNTQYQALLKSFEEVRILEAQTSDFMSVVEEALPGKLISTGPRRLINGLQGLALGLFAGIGIALLVEYLRVNVRSGEEIERITGLSTLGFIAEIKDHPLITRDQPRAPTSEAYRVLRTNIDFSATDTPIQSIVITSASPREGKTTTAANLAVIIAQSGKRVILMDADLRRPTIHRLFRQPNTRGVTTALLDESRQSLRDHLAPTGVDNLFMMPSGPLPPNPADLLGSNRMVALLDDLKTVADVVVIDTAPILAVADPMLIGRIADAVLLVVQFENTSGDALRRVMEQVTKVGINMVGAVLNRVSGSGDGYYTYYYYDSEDA